jgi:transposase
MRYLGIDVHSRASVWCLLDEQGEVCGRGHVETTGPALESLVTELSANDKLRVGQEVGTMAYLVHDAVSGAGAQILSFNAYHLRMIASSRKKTDRRDAYWIARALQTGMHPHPVYMATGEIRELRALLSRRRLILVDRNRWQHRARSLLRGSGLRIQPGSCRLGAAIEELLASPTGLDAYACESLELCQRQQAALTIELQRVEAEVRQHSRRIDAIRRLQTIPAVIMEGRTGEQRPFLAFVVSFPRLRH